MRLDSFLSARFPDRSRTGLVKGIKRGEVCDQSGSVYKPSQVLKGGEVLHLFLPGIAPDGPPPPMPRVLFEDARIAVIDKPAGLVAHPAGTAFRWSVIGLAKAHWPDHRIDLVHRLDRETSGAVLLTKDLEANRVLKADFKAGRTRKVYEALVIGVPPWSEVSLDGPIGSADGPIRLQMAVRADGLPARTDVTVLETRRDLTRVRCRLHTGRTHQIRVHLAHAGFPILGDKLYATPPDVALACWDAGVFEQAATAAGAPRQALHAAELGFTHPDGPEIIVEAPFPADLAAWWDGEPPFPPPATTG